MLVAPGHANPAKTLLVLERDYRIDPGGTQGWQ
jgi:hypothetical protein